MPRRARLVLLGVLVVLDLLLTVFLARGVVRPPAPVAVSAAGPQVQRESFESRARARYDAPVSSRTYSAYMSPLTFGAEGRPSNAAMKAGHAVWVVTVFAPNGACDRCSMERPRRLHHAYSVVYDASTGAEVDFCGGCEWLQESRPDSASEQLVSRSPAWLQDAAVWLVSRR
jgi:hypothetical protein